MLVFPGEYDGLGLGRLEANRVVLCPLYFMLLDSLLVVGGVLIAALT